MGACLDCKAPHHDKRTPRCLACRTKARLTKQRLYEAARREAERQRIAALSPEEQERARAERIAEKRAKYRARNPLPPCQVCGQPCARSNQTECDACCPNLARRQAHRERERLRGIRRRGQT